MFEHALAKDSLYAPAWAALADAHLSLATRESLPADVMPKAEAAAERAIELDEGLAEAHRALGRVLFQWAWDWSGAEREFKRAIELGPGNAEARRAYGTLLSALGRADEALAEIWLAQEQDPLSASVNVGAGWISFQARRFDEAMVEFGKAIEREPSAGVAYAGLAIALVQRGRFAEALRAAEKAVDADQSPMVLAMASGVYAADGQRTMARRLEALAAQGRVCPLDVAATHVALKEPDEAFRWLDRGFKERSPCLPFVRTDARLDPLRADRRYTDLIRRMSFPK